MSGTQQPNVKCEERVLEYLREKGGRRTSGLKCFKDEGKYRSKWPPYQGSSKERQVLIAKLGELNSMSYKSLHTQQS